MFDRSNGELAAVTRQLHDLWFEVAEFRSDRVRGTVLVPILAAHQPRPSAEFRDRWLRIGRVQEMKLEESERVGRYDFGEFRYSPRAALLELRTGIPLTFELSVSRLDMAVLDSPEPDP